VLEIIGWHFRAATSAALVGSIWALVIVVILSALVMVLAPAIALWWRTWWGWMGELFGK
jgi:hypothetical protein